MSDTTNTKENEAVKIAHQAVVVEETFVGTKDSGDTHVKDIKLPAGSTMIHPEAADRIRDEYDINHLHKFGVYVAPEREDE